MWHLRVKTLSLVESGRVYCLGFRFLDLGLRVSISDFGFRVMGPAHCVTNDADNYHKTSSAESISGIDFGGL